MVQLPTFSYSSPTLDINTPRCQYSDPNLLYGPFAETKLFLNPDPTHNILYCKYYSPNIIFCPTPAPNLIHCPPSTLNLICGLYN